VAMLRKELKDTQLKIEKDFKELVQESDKEAIESTETGENLSSLTTITMLILLFFLILVFALVFKMNSMKKKICQ
jgi:hypothetical protein